MCLRRFTSTSWQDVHEARDRKGQFAIAAFLPYIHPSRFSIPILCENPILDPSRNLYISLPRLPLRLGLVCGNLTNLCRPSNQVTTMRARQETAPTSGHPAHHASALGLELTLTPSQSELGQIQGHKGALRSAMVPPLRQ